MQTERLINPPKHAGFGLVEVLVGMVVALTTILMMMQMFAVNEGFKENTVSTNSAQSNGSTALFMMERDVRMGGYGFASSFALGCGTIQYYYEPNYSSPPDPSGTLPTLVMAPVVITQGVNAPDTVAVMYTTNAYRMFPATITKTMPSPSAELNVDSVSGFKDGDLVVLVEGATCAMAQVTNVQASALKLQHNPGSSAPFNPPGGGSLLPAFTSGALIYNFGSPVVRTYSISPNSTLIATDWMGTLTGASALSIAGEIVDLQADYGKDNGVDNGTVVAPGTPTANDGIVDSYETATPASGAAWQQVLSIRLAVLARGAWEKPNTAGTCTATTVAPSWAGGSFNISDGLPSCFKYRVFETVIPLRNMIWRDA